MIKGRLLILLLAHCCFLLSDGAPTLEQKMTEWKALQLPAVNPGRNVGDIWTNCGSPGDHGKIINASIVPNPPVIGQDVNVSAYVETDEEITGGMVKMHLVYSSSVPYDKSFDFCELTKKVGHPCPIPKGQVKVFVSTKIPQVAPKGDYDGQVVVTDQNKQQLACIKLHLTLNDTPSKHHHIEQN